MGLEAGGEQDRGIGARLRAARERKGYTLLQAAEKLHVDARVLESLESEDFAALGADVYVRGHLRRYADLTGESASELPRLYADRNRPVDPDLTRIPRAEPPPSSSRIMLPVLLAVVGCALAGAVWWLHSLPGQRARAIPPPSGAVNLAAATTLAGATMPPGAPARTGATTPAATPQAEPAPTAPLVPEAPGDEGVDGTATPAGAEPPPAGAEPPPAGGEPARAPPGQAQLELRLAGPSWVQVTDAAGRRLLSGLVAGGSERTLAGTPPLRVVLGNAPAVTLRLNGRPVALAGLVKSDGSARFAIDGAGAASAGAPPAARGE